MKKWFLIASVLSLPVVAVGVSSAAPPLPGAIFTTDSTCSAVNLNLYSSKLDVYLNGGPQHPGSAGLADGSYYVQVTEPEGKRLGTSIGSSNPTPVHVTNGEFDHCYQLWAILIKASNGTQGYDDTGNPGGEYKVWVSNEPGFTNDSTKTDNFKVQTSASTPTPTNTPVPAYTSTPTPTATKRYTSTPTCTPWPTRTPTATPAYKRTRTNTPTPTNTPLPGETQTPTITPSATNTPTATSTYKRTRTNTPTPTNTPLPGETQTPTNTPTATNTSTPTSTPLPGETPTRTTTATNTSTPTNTPVPGETQTPTNTPTLTNTPLPGETQTPTTTPTATNTSTPTNTPVPGETQMPTSTTTATNTSTPTSQILPPVSSPTPTATSTPLPGETQAPTNTPTPTSQILPPVSSPTPTATNISPAVSPTPGSTTVPPTASPTPVATTAVPAGPTPAGQAPSTPSPVVTAVIPLGFPHTGKSAASRAVPNGLDSHAPDLAAAMNGGPQRLIIPRLGIDTPVNGVGLKANGEMAVPDKAVGWFALGPQPGDPGSAVMDGHLDTVYGPSIFWNLNQLQFGDAIFVTDDQGNTIRFRVLDLRLYDATAAPPQTIFAPGEKARLNLITCSGMWNSQLHNYSQRLVVFAVEAPLWRHEIPEE